MECAEKLLRRAPPCAPWRWCMFTCNKWNAREIIAAVLFSAVLNVPLICRARWINGIGCIFADRLAARRRNSSSMFQLEIACGRDLPTRKGILKFFMTAELNVTKLPLYKRTGCACSLYGGRSLNRLLRKVTLLHHARKIKFGWISLTLYIFFFIKK